MKILPLLLETIHKPMIEPWMKFSVLMSWNIEIEQKLSKTREMAKQAF